MKRMPVLIPFLAVVCAIFIGILIYAYVETKQANPQMLDEQGRRVSSVLHRIQESQTANRDRLHHSHDV